MYPTSASPTAGVCVEHQVESLRSAGLQVRVSHVDRLNEGPFVYYRMSPAIRREVTDFRPDVVHVMYGGVMADQITRMPGLPPVVVTYRGSDLLGENLSGWKRKLISHYGVWCSRKAALAAAGVVVVARQLLQALPPPFSSQGAQTSARRAIILPSGIDLDRFKPLDQRTCQQKLGWNPDRFHVLFATNNQDPVKRPWLARAAVEHLKTSGLRAEFQCLSGVKHAEVPDWINASDVFLLTSDHEGSPSIVREALACEVPVVSVPVGDVAEQIAGIDGCYLADPDAAELARKLELVQRRKTRLHCRSQLEAVSHRALARRLIHFYQDILAVGPKVQPTS